MVYYGRGNSINNPEINHARSFDDIVHAMHICQPTRQLTGCARVGRSLSCLLFLPIAAFLAVIYGGLSILVACVSAVLDLCACCPQPSADNVGCHRRLLSGMWMWLLWPVYAAQQVCSPEPWEDDWSSPHRSVDGQRDAAATGADKV